MSRSDIYSSARRIASGAKNRELHPSDVIADALKARLTAASVEDSALLSDLLSRLDAVEIVKGPKR